MEDFLSWLYALLTDWTRTEDGQHGFLFGVVLSVVVVWWLVAKESIEVTIRA